MQSTACARGLGTISIRTGAANHAERNMLMGDIFQLYLGLLTEPVERTVARTRLLQHAVGDWFGVTAPLVDAYERDRLNTKATTYVVNTLLNVGSRRMGSCLRGEPCIDEFTGSQQVKAVWARYRAAGGAA